MDRMETALTAPRWERLPEAVRFALGRLEERGFEAALVGGCVRDSLLGIAVGDYDLATSARPEEVAAAFAGERIVPTGLRHGTVTLVAGRTPIEITTFRRDGAYSDLRRPDSVSFTRSLRADVERRDFTMNAIAWERGAGLIDYVGGLEDLRRMRIRAVGDPRRRFGEDALRIMRALRFRAQLGGPVRSCAIDPATSAAIREMYPSLRRIAAERVWKEMEKLLAGAGSEVIREYPEVFRLLLPCLGALPEEETTRAAGRLARAEGLVRDSARWAALLYAAGPDAAAETLLGLRADRRTIVRTRACIAAAQDVRPEEAALRRCIGAAYALGEAGAAPEQVRSEARLFVRDAVCIAFAFADEPRLEALRLLEEIGERGLPCGRIDLAVTGGDLAALGLRGRAVGEALEALLAEVVDGRLDNEREGLLARAKARLA